VDEKKKNLLIPLAVGAVGLVMAHHKMVLSGFAFTQSDPGDTRGVQVVPWHHRTYHVLLWKNHTLSS
jgi:hypothetical protein